MGLVITAAFAVSVLVALLPVRHPRVRLGDILGYLAVLAVVIIISLSFFEVEIVVLTFGPGVVIALVRAHIARADIRTKVGDSDTI